MRCQRTSGASGSCDNFFHGAGVFVFTASASVGDPLYAPLAPPCGPALCPGPATTTYSFDSNVGGGFGQFCAGVAVDAGSPGVVNVGLRVQDADVLPTCRITSTGTVAASPLAAPLSPNDGPWCGLSSGSGSVNATAGSWSAPAGTTVAWLTSAGTVLPLVLSVNGTPAGAGAVQTTGAQPGTCGLVPPAFAPTTSFTVTGFSAFVA